MDRTWVLIADSHRARLFERLANVHALVELANFVFPNTHAMGDGHDHAGEGERSKGHGRTGHAGTRARSLNRTPIGKPKTAAFSRNCWLRI
jgi:hypothetical protein